MGAQQAEAKPEDAALAVSAALLDAARALGAHADASFAASWGWEARTKVLAALDRTFEVAGVYRSLVLAAHKADGQWARSGDRSFETWRGRTSRKGAGAARAESELAEGLAALPQAARAVEDGDVSLAHAEVLTRLRARSSDTVRTALDVGGAEELLATAARQQLDAPTFARRAAAWAAAQDVDAAERSFEAVRARRYARVADREGGTRLEAFLDPIAGASLRTALESLTPVPSPDDGRTSEQRAADALAALAGRVLDGGLDKIGAQIRPHLSLLVPADTWAAIRRRRQAGRAGAAPTDVAADGTTPGRPAPEDSAPGNSALEGTRPGGLAPEGPTPARAVVSVDAPASTPLAELDDGAVVPPSALERIACDCEMTRIVLDAESIPLDVGQTQRTYTKALRRAVLTRDAHCQWPGCTLRATWCEVHHIRWYSRGGPTSLANGLALCVFHHHEVHRRHITITRVPGGTTFSRPDGSIIGTTIRHNGARRLIRATRVADETGRRDPLAGRLTRSARPPDEPRGAAPSEGRHTPSTRAPNGPHGAGTPRRSRASDRASASSTTRPARPTTPQPEQSVCTPSPGPQRARPPARRAPDDLFGGGTDVGAPDEPDPP